MISTILNDSHVTHTQLNWNFKLKKMRAILNAKMNFTIIGANYGEFSKFIDVILYYAHSFMGLLLHLCLCGEYGPNYM